MLPAFEHQWREILNANDDDFLKLFKSFPSHSFRLEGFCMFWLEDVSKDMAMNRLKDAILNMHTTDLPNTVKIVENAVGELLGDPKIRIEIIPFFKINGRVVYNTSVNNRHLNLSCSEKRLEDGRCIEDIYNTLVQTPKPYIFSNFDKEFIISRTSLSDLQKHEIKNYLVYPITTTRDGLMGVFELEKGNITNETIDILQPAFPLVTDLIYHMVELFDNKINKLVKEKFTPLLQSVEWKFNEVAWEYLQHEGNKKAEDIIGDVVFKHVYPFYGAVDIRDSSIERNNAVKNDHLKQLRETLHLLEKTSDLISLPLLDSLKFKCGKFIAAIKGVLSSENEMKINKFFRNEVLVFLRYLQERFPEYQKEVDAYFQKMNREKGEFHQHVNAYESSVQMINRSVVKYFDEEVQRLQNIYPFYYEKYRTDGLEYNFYLGQSIVPTQNFDKIYLENVRLWQVSSMAEIAINNQKMLASMPIPLRTTQLILAHHVAIDISFRKDERRFDVEGSYNIRYEILKKRIDKVRIKSSLERLTQPDKIAFVYSTSDEVEEYIQHISFLQSKGVLTEAIERLELENLQGISGLKALRVTVRSGD
jgi:hypothetical protein